ncbi:MAG: transcriptional regulator [Thermoproteota archaeon]|nr:transcriptional regulator [Thermoproteota archaeon]
MSSRKVTQIKLPVRTKNNTTDEILSTILAYGEQGISQTEISKIFSLDSRDSSRIVGSLEKQSLITREKMLYKGRWTFKLIVKKSLYTDQYSKSIDIQSIEKAPCFRCLHQHSCSPDDDTSQYNPSKCMWIEDWVLASNNTVLTSQPEKESR